MRPICVATPCIGFVHRPVIVKGRARDEFKATFRQNDDDAAEGPERGLTGSDSDGAAAGHDNLSWGLHCTSQVTDLVIFFSIHRGGSRRSFIANFSHLGGG